MSKRARLVSFGFAGLLVLAGAVDVAVTRSVAGQIIGLVLVGLGLIGATSLVFFEVGLSEDRELARGAHEAAARKEARVRARRRPGAPLGRMRGERRRLG